MIPSKDQFQALIKACETDRLTSLLNPLLGDVTENRIKAVLESYDKTLNIIFLTQIHPLPVYQWLNGQQPFLLAQRKLFSDDNRTWLVSQVEEVLKQLEENEKQPQRTSKEKNNQRKSCLRQITHQMQLRSYWFTIVAKSLCAYHYPESPNMGKIREKGIEAGKQAAALQLSLLELTGFSEFMPGLPLPDHDLINRLEKLAYILEPENVNKLTPIKRADSSYMERLFVVQMANGHTKLLQRGDGIPTVIADLFYLHGFANPLDERTVRRICSEQEQRRNEAKRIHQNTAAIYPIGQLSSKN